MQLDDSQKAALASWIEAGASLSEAQKRIKEEFGISLTYLETRLLFDDLKLQPKDPEKPKAEPPPVIEEKPAGAAKAGTGGVSVTIDQITRPGAMISGRVTFSDGETADWYLDGAGRLGLNPSKPGYRPTQQDILSFQDELERAARSHGY
ncbi:MAG: hypothetical protein N2322_04135 [Terrimicrobiaceae bacterium]|nr:hypothetical protein [Terrimicrobiaceae bacterium]